MKGIWSNTENTLYPKLLKQHKYDLYKTKKKKSTEVKSSSV